MKTMKRAACLIAFIAAFCVCFYAADRLTRRDDGARKYDAFFAEKGEIDVFFMGTSRMFDSVQPMEIWRDTGITSYNLANSSECPQVTEWVLKLAMQTHQPKVAFFDVYYINRNIDDAWAYTYRHMFLDEIPLSPLKIEAVTSTLPRDQWMEFLMPFSLYHGRWEEILSGNVTRMVDCEPYMMGSELRIGRTQGQPFTRTSEADHTPLAGRDALGNLAQYCFEHGIQPVFIAIPAPVSEQEQMYMNSVQALADEMGVPFLNLFEEEGLVDYNTDCYDAVGHLNPDGAAKVTAYVSDWLQANCDLPDRREDAAYAHWHQNLAQYEDYWNEHWSGMTLLGEGA